MSSAAQNREEDDGKETETELKLTEEKKAALRKAIEEDTPFAEYASRILQEAR
jgi:hypothetical protein